MSEAWAMIIVAVLTLIGTIFVQVNGNRVNLYRIQQLEEQVSKHNNLIERTYKVEESISVMKTDLENVKKEVSEIHEHNN